MKYTFLLLTLLLFTSPAFAQDRNFRLVKVPTQNPANQKRKAVVIGMSDYGGNRRLDNTVNDADDMADVFTRLGFEVTLLKNNDLRTLKANLINWYNTIAGNDVAVFYFAGHGMEVNGKNYLIPIDAELNSETDVEFNTLNVNQVLGNMNEKRVGMKLLILDACRDNPFTRSWYRGGDEEKGLAQMSAPIGTYIAFAASPGSTAQEGKNYNLPNGVFTYYLKHEILKAGATIDEILTNVTEAVFNLTHEQQIPFRNSSLTKPFIPNPIFPDKQQPPPPPVDAAELVRRANAYYNKKQYSDAVPLYKQAAEKGNATAQYILGGCYYNAYGVAKDDKQAIVWFRKAAEQGNANAQNSLGYCYEEIKDYNQAVLWYTKSAGQGNAEAQNRLGNCYLNGNGVAQDHNQAVYWFKKAAEQGLANAQANLGYYYGIINEDEQAVYWFNKAALQGLDDAQYNLGNCYQYGNGTAKDYNQAVYWYKKAAGQGNGNAKDALKKLGINYP